MRRALLIEEGGLFEERRLVQISCSREVLHLRRGPYSKEGACSTKYGTFFLVSIHKKCTNLASKLPGMSYVNPKIQIPSVVSMFQNVSIAGQLTGAPNEEF